MKQHVLEGSVVSRIWFLSGLSEAGPAAATALPELFRALTDRESEIRAEAAEALGSVGRGPTGNEVIPKLIAALKDADHHVRENAVYALLRIGPRTEKVIPAIASALADSDDSSAAEIALIELGMRSMPVVLPLLADPNSAISEGAESVLSHLAVDDETVPGETAAQAADRTHAVHLALVAALKCPSKRARYHAAQALLYAGEPHVSSLALGLEDPAPLLRLHAAYAIEDVEPAKARVALDSLQKCLQDPSAEVRTAAAAAIKKIRKSR